MSSVVFIENFVWIVCLMSIECASAQGPSPGRFRGLAAIDDRWSIQVVTVDSDGYERVTRIWIAVVAGSAAIRTADSPWWANLQRDSRIRLSGKDLPFRVEFVTEPEGKIRIDEVFLEKYGWWERIRFSQERGEMHNNYARLRP